MANLQEAWDAIPPNDITEIVLVAPNKRVAKEWLKMYPGIKIILEKDHKGYDLPKGYPSLTDLVAPDSEAKNG